MRRQAMGYVVRGRIGGPEPNSECGAVRHGTLSTGNTMPEEDPESPHLGRET